MFPNSALPVRSDLYDFTTRLSVEGSFGELWKVRVRSTNLWEVNPSQYNDLTGSLNTHAK